jgi:hypothetical protein
MRRSAFSVRKDEGKAHVEAYSSSSFGHSHERGLRTALETLSEHGNDDWRLGTDGDGTHLIDFRVVYQHAPGGPLLEFDMVDYCGGAEL